MKALLDKLHAKLGDFWWYSLMIFAASRVSDALNVFVGLWLVPKYIDPSELGAVLPLTQFSIFLAIPASVLATTLMKELTTLSARGEYGQMKNLMRGIFLCTAVFLVLAIVAARLLMPLLLERLRVGEGSLCILVLASGFIGAAAPVYLNALQALKKFKTLSFINIASAPVRLCTMLVAMPFRPISGYFLGQTATPAFHIVASLLALRKELKVKAVRYWSMPVVRRLFLFFCGIALYNLSSSLANLIEQTVIRQRLPDLDSAAYYMLSRFSDISGFIIAAMLTIMFPFTAELAEQGKDTRPLVVKSSLATLAISAVLALGFAIFGEQILAILPHGSDYRTYAWALPWMIGITAVGGIFGFYVTAETSAARFGFLKWWAPLHIAYPVCLLLVTGHGYFVEWLSPGMRQFLNKINVLSLTDMLWWISAVTLIRTLCCVVGLCRPAKCRHQ